MQSASVIRIEKNVDRAASALFALACGYAANLWFAGELLKPVLGIATIAAIAFAYLVSTRALGAVHPELPRLPIPIFDVREVDSMDFGAMDLGELSPANGAEPTQVAEPLLTDRVELAPKTGEEPLLLDDILAEPGSNSRVVRLFDPSKMPTAGELNSRIGGHLDSEVSAAQSHDAAQALHDALAELRRSLR
ncbi:MAG TPA: hypothetical protein VGQ34_07955 [Sphingomicrobium sp.]|nr:hypothetical protein [Sphingomicrobium sp.]